ncbi:Secretion protein HlyD [gamma proteobacterium IMCC2047]|nr:Secretion protein HlyD [gamma proteobacterium IMCC2047]
MNKHLLTLTLSAAFFISSNTAFASDEHDHENDGHHEAHLHQTETEHDKHDHAENVIENVADQDSHGDDAHDEGGVALSTAQTNLANIEVQALTPRKMDYQVYAPGEIQANGYTNYRFLLVLNRWF